MSYVDCDKKCESLCRPGEQSQLRAGLRWSVRVIPLAALLPSWYICAGISVISYKGKNINKTPSGPWHPSSPRHRLTAWAFGWEYPEGYRTHGCILCCRALDMCKHSRPSHPVWLIAPLLLTSIIFNFLAADAGRDTSPGLLHENTI